MIEVVLLYDRDCPHVATTRDALLRAFAAAGLPPRWTELDLASPDTPDAWRGHGSPTVLVDGVDALGSDSDAAGPTCRVYDGASGAPPVDALAAALARGTADPSRGGRWRTVLATAPGVGVALLPKLACPACWPAYAGLLSSVGLGFLIQVRYLLPLTAAFLAVALAAIGWGARARRGYGPLLVGMAAAAVLLVGKFSLDSTAGLWIGLAGLVGASAWNAWPRRGPAVTSVACAACAFEAPRGDGRRFLGGTP